MSVMRACTKGIINPLPAPLFLVFTSFPSFPCLLAVERLVAIKEEFIKRGPNWKREMETWVCPTNPATSNGTCDPCGASQYWGNWENIACRGDSVKQLDILGGDGHVTNFHFTARKVSWVKICPGPQVKN